MAWVDELVPVDLTVEQDGKTISARELPFVKESPDLGHFIKKAIDTHREVGSRVPVKIERIRNEDGTFKPNAEAVTNWKKDHLPKLYEAGILERPPAEPKDYGITKPEKLAAGITWDDERAGKLATTLHKHGIPKSAVPDLIALHEEALLGTQGKLKVTHDEAMIVLKKEHGDKFDERSELAKRLTNVIFKSPEDLAFMEVTGIGNHPTFLNILMRLAPYAQQDSSIMTDLNAQGSGNGGATVTPEAAKAELADIMNNPKNSRYEGWHRGDKSVQDYIDSLYAKAYGKGTKEIGSGVEILAGRT